MMRVVMGLGLVVALAVLTAGCGGTPATTAAPTLAPPTQTPSAPTAPPTAAPTQAPTEVPTQPPPTAEPTATMPSARVAFNWAAGSVPPSDADDVDIIAIELRTHAGILSANGNETVLNVFYDPTVITVEAIMELLRQLGHPVVIIE